MQDAEKQICAVVVTFHPDRGVTHRLKALADQAGGLVIVDNGSTEPELAPMRAMLAQQTVANMALLEQGENLGIATALNLGVRWASAHEFSHVILFDQDSQITDGFVASMQRCWAASRWGLRLSILVPAYIDGRLEVSIPPNRVRDDLDAAMTSGSMIPVELFERIGFFLDELFIDGVDYEFSLRARAAGLVIDECSEAVLRHSPGDPRVVSWRGRRLYQTANYSPARRYYQERNKVWISKRYFRRYPVFCIKLFLYTAKDFVKILVAEKDSAEKARYFLRGLWDGLRERMGRLE